MRGRETSGTGPAGRGPMRWVAVPDARGRLRMEMRWSVPEREVTLDVAGVPPAAQADRVARVPSGSHAA